MLKNTLYAVPVVDSFHVIQWIIRSIDNYIRQLLKKYRQRDREYQDKISYEQQYLFPFHPRMKYTFYKNTDG